MALYNYIAGQGVILPDTAELRKDIETEYKEVFGADLITTPETPQGVLITAETEARDAVVRNNAELANQINPNIAGGIFLDALFALMGGERRGATQSVLNDVQFFGVRGTLIPKGTTAEVKETGERFITISGMKLDDKGEAVGDMIAVNYGAIQCTIGALEVVSSSILGWERVYNPHNAVIGSDKESDVKARRRRLQTLSSFNTSQCEAITSELYNIDSVRSLSFRENTSHDWQEIDGINMKPHSIYVCVEGGTDDEICQALLKTKTCGSGYNGDHTVEAVDGWSGQKYQIQFDRPEEIIFYIRVHIKPTTVDYESVIQDAVRMFINGEIEGEEGLLVGEDVSSHEISGAISIVEPRLYIRKTELSLDGVNWSSDEIKIDLKQVARTSERAVIVKVY